MRRDHIYGITACVAVLATAGCSSGGSTSSFGLPEPNAVRDSLGRRAVGAITEYTVPHSGKNVPKTFPVGITTGPDRRLVVHRARFR